MLYTKFDGHQPTGFRQEDFKRVFTIYGQRSQYDQLGPFEQTVILTTRKSSTWNLASMGLGALQQKNLKV